MAAIQSILFDLGNVLIDLDIPRTERRFHELLGDAFQASFARNEQAGVFRQFELGEISAEAFLQCLRELSGGRAHTQELQEAWNALLIGMPLHRFQMLEALRADYKLYVLSNTNALHIEWVRADLRNRLGIHQFEAYFDQVFYSHEIHLRKPDRAVYEYVLRSAGLQADALLFIDDNPGNVRAAAALGIQSYLHADGRDVSEYLCEQGLLKKDFAKR